MLDSEVKGTIHQCDDPFKKLTQMNSTGKFVLAQNLLNYMSSVSHYALLLPFEDYYLDCVIPLIKIIK